MKNSEKLYIRVILLVVLCYSCIYKSSGQSIKMVHEGKISYERKINVYALLNKYYATDDALKQFAAEYKNNHPQFQVRTFTLTFNDHISVFAPEKETDGFSDDKNDFLDMLAGLNTVWTSFDSRERISKKIVFDKTYTISDSLKNIRWKMTSETREIAGYVCRRANAVISDSLYVVAYYTDQIVPKAGPESLHGLPGMILGLALPHEHVTWFASKVSVIKPMENIAKVPDPEKNKITSDELQNILLKNPALPIKDKRSQFIIRKILL